MASENKSGPTEPRDTGEPMESMEPTELTPDERYVDEPTKEKIRQHLSDPHSRITEQDLQNVNTDMFRRDEDELTDAVSKSDERTEPEEEIAPKPPNTWDLLEE